MYHGGYPQNVEKIYELKKKYKFFIIEDACHALGSEYKYKKKFYKIDLVNTQISQLFLFIL